MFMLKIQGVSFAKNDKDNKKILDKYYRTKTKDKKLRSINYYWIKSTIKDILTKFTTVALSTYLIVDIVIKGSNDWSLMLLAVVNLLMFISFGLLALTNAYEFYNNNHIPFIIDKLEEQDKKQTAQQIEGELQNEFKIVYRQFDKLLKQKISERKSVVSIPDIPSKEL